jgi:hypothetical protein
MRLIRRGGLVVVLAVVASVAVACGQNGSTATLDVSPVEGAIAHSILTQRNVTTVVTCPANLPLETGYRFTCSAALDAGSYPVSVVELNDRGGVSYSNSTPLRMLSSHTVAVAIQAAIARKKHLRATVKCPQTILQTKGLVFTCTATTKLGTGRFAVTESDANGHVVFKGL